MLRRAKKCWRITKIHWWLNRGLWNVWEWLSSTSPVLCLVRKRLSRHRAQVVGIALSPRRDRVYASSWTKIARFALRLSDSKVRSKDDSPYYLINILEPRPARLDHTSNIAAYTTYWLKLFAISAYPDTYGFMKSLHPRGRLHNKIVPMFHAC